MKKYSFRKNNLEEEEEEEVITEIKVIDNDIYIYSPITLDLASNVNSEILKLEKKLRTMSIQYSIDPPPINIHINSEGGELVAGISISEAIRNCKVKTVSIIEGEAASAATLISVVADVRKITKNSNMLIHQLSAEFWGKHNEFEDEMKNQKRLMNIIKTIYNENTSMTKKKLGECLTKDVLWSANQCLANGLVDEII